jgi:hypothetical protein
MSVELDKVLAVRFYCDFHHPVCSVLLNTHI